jgi:hypothetical protein
MIPELNIAQTSPPEVRGGSGTVTSTCKIITLQPAVLKPRVVQQGNGLTEILEAMRNENERLLLLMDQHFSGGSSAQVD